MPQKPGTLSKILDFVLKIIRQIIDKLFDPYDGTPKIFLDLKELFRFIVFILAILKKWSQGPDR
jgi:hypothetical protein